MTCDSLIFDLDGTLWDALGVSAEAWAKGFQSLGLNTVVTRADLKKVVGQPFVECVESFLPGIIVRQPEIISSIEKHERELIEAVGGSIYDDVQEGLAKLAKRYKLFIVSNCQDWYLKAFLKQSKAQMYFTDSDCFGKSKILKAEMITRIVLRHGLKTPVYIGDTLSDYQSSVKAETDFIHAAYGFGEIDLDCKRVSSFGELVKICSTL
jgi:phosphoglycolate phosphatase